MHTRVSHDSSGDPSAMVKKAEALGLREICFTDHYDETPLNWEENFLFDTDEYKKAYADLRSDKLKIRLGVEFGLVEHNVGEMERLSRILNFDFVIGSVHFADGHEMYMKEYWEGRDVGECFESFLKQELKCVRLHDDFDVLGHINYVCKSPFNPCGRPLLYKDFPDLFDDIMKVVIEKGKGLEINTSGVDRVGIFLPDADCLRRYKALGGKIITVGSDAHDASRVGQYTDRALDILKDIFGYVCTFEKRMAIYHRL